jgi:hypothetical protein
MIHTDNHESFKHRLRQHEAELVYQYVENIQQGRIAVNYDKVDILLQRFTYFTKYSKQIRYGLFKECKLIKYNQNETIFK